MNKDAKIKVLIVDDHSVVRLGLSALLGYQEDLIVIGEAEDGESAVRIAQEKQPNVVVMDLMMPGMDGVEATRLIHSKDASIKILILTTFGTSADVARAIAAGALLRAVMTTSAASPGLRHQIVRCVRIPPVDAFSPPHATPHSIVWSPAPDFAGCTIMSMVRTLSSG